MALHVDIPTRDEIEALLAERRPGCVSIYLPTSPLPQEAEPARISFASLVRVAAGQLDGDRVIAEQLEDLLDDDDFWRLLAHSLAVFATADAVHTFRLPNQLASIVEVSDRFHIKPLLRAVTFPHAAFVLALAQGSVRLIEVTADAPAEEVAVADLPADAASAVRRSSITDRAPSRRLQGSEGQKVLLRQYARRVDRALRPVLAGAGLPLILACAEPLNAIYRSLNSYPGLVEQGIPGNPEAASPGELAAAARGVLDELYAAQLAELRDLFALRVVQGRTAVDLTDLARAATFGAVDTLLADMDEVISGYVDEQSGAVTLDSTGDAKNYGVVDEIARRVLLAGGRVFALRRDDIPGGASAAAILRYAA